MKLAYSTIRKISLATNFPGGEHFKFFKTEEHHTTKTRELDLEKENSILYHLSSCLVSRQITEGCNVAIRFNQKYKGEIPLTK